MRRPGGWSGLVVNVLAVAVIGACAAPGSAPRSAGDTQPGQAVAPARTKALTIGVTGSVPALSIAGGASPVGGWVAMTEMHTDGLITADINAHRPVGRLAERVPSLDDGSISLLPDGRMKVVFNLRNGITWQDGVPFTADDLVFSHQLGGPGCLPPRAHD